MPDDGGDEYSNGSVFPQLMFRFYWASFTGISPLIRDVRTRVVNHLGSDMILQVWPMEV